MANDYVNHGPVIPHTYTHIGPLDSDEDIVVCNDCGASAESEDEVKHHPTCHPGESNFWAQYYEENPDGDEVETGEWDDFLDDDPSPYDGTYSEE